MKDGNLPSARGFLHGLSPFPFSIKDFLLTCETVARDCSVTTSEAFWDAGAASILTFTSINVKKLH